MIDISQNHRLIIKDLYHSIAGLNPYTFYRRYKISPDVLIKILNDLEEQNLVIYDQIKIRLTTLGRHWVIKNRYNQLYSAEKPWRKPPISDLAPKLSINKPYIPRLSLLDKKLLSNHWKKKKG
jgi:hypothetical protein